MAKKASKKAMGEKVFRVWEAIREYALAEGLAEGQYGFEVNITSKNADGEGLTLSCECTSLLGGQG